MPNFHRRLLSDGSGLYTRAPPREEIGADPFVDCPAQAQHAQEIAAAGLVVATPTFVAYSYLSSRVTTMLHDMERAGIEIVHMLTESRPISGIISFQQPDEAAAREREARQDL